MSRIVLFDGDPSSMTHPSTQHMHCITRPPYSHAPAHPSRCVPLHVFCTNKKWLCYAQTSEQVAKTRLLRFFSSLYATLKRGSRAALQFYPDSTEQAVLISSCAARHVAVFSPLLSQIYVGDVSVPLLTIVGLSWLECCCVSKPQTVCSCIQDTCA